MLSFRFSIPYQTAFYDFLIFIISSYTVKMRFLFYCHSNNKTEWIACKISLLHLMKEFPNINKILDDIINDTVKGCLITLNWYWVLWIGYNSLNTNFHGCSFDEPQIWILKKYKIYIKLKSKLLQYKVHIKLSFNKMTIYLQVLKIGTHKYKSTVNVYFL